MAKVALPRFSPELLRYNARLVVLSSYWLFVAPLVAGQLMLLWYMAMKSLVESNAAYVARTTELAAPLFAAFLCAHVLAPEYRHRLEDLVFSRPVPFARTVAARLVTMYVFIVALTAAMLFVYKTVLGAQYDLSAVVLAGLPAVFFLSMLALAVAAVWHSPMVGFGVAAAVWAGDALFGTAVNPLLTLHAYANQAAGVPGAGEDLVASKAILCLAGAVLAWVAARAVGRPAGPLRWRALARTGVVVACGLLLYVASGAYYKMQHLTALEGDRAALQELRLSHQQAFVAYGRLPVAYLFGPAYPLYLGYPLSRDFVETEHLRGQQRLVDRLRRVVFSYPNSRWADNAFYELILAAARVSDDSAALKGGTAGESINRQTALQYCRQFLRDYPRSPFAPLVAERMLAVAQVLDDEGQMRSAYDLLVTTFAADPLAAQTAQKMMAYYAARGRVEEAVRAGETAVRAMAAGGDPEALCAIGDFLRSVGRTDSARRAYQQALATARAARGNTTSGLTAEGEVDFAAIKARGKLRRAEKTAQAKLQELGAP